MNRHTVKEVHMPDLIKKLVEKWVTQSRGKSYKGKVEFLNRTKDESEWKNDDTPTG